MGTKTKRKSKEKNRIKKKIEAKYKWIKYLKIALVIFLAVTLVRFGVLLVKTSKMPEAPKDKISYPVRGVDVSVYQGKIDWEKIREQGISFAYIKASEGSSHVDSRFFSNWKNADKAGLVRGAYHFMRFDTSGKAQAQNFIKQLEETKDIGKMLPPVIDVELYGKYLKKVPSKEHLRGILSDMSSEIKDKYGVAPVIYTTRHIYSNYIDGVYKNEIWIANPELDAKLPSGRDWLFCQYSISGKLRGFKGESSHIDLNVYNGTKFSFVRRFR